MTIFSNKILFTVCLLQVLNAYSSVRADEPQNAQYMENSPLAVHIRDVPDEPKEEPQQMTSEDLQGLPEPKENSAPDGTLNNSDGSADETGNPQLQKKNKSENTGHEGSPEQPETAGTVSQSDTAGGTGEGSPENEKNGEPEEDNSETIIYSDVDFDSASYLDGLFINNFFEQHDSPNQMEKVLRLKRVIYIDPDLDFDNYTFVGYQGILEPPEFGTITESDRRLTYVMDDLSKLQTKNGIAPLSDNFTLFRYETDEHLVTTRVEVRVTVYFSFDPLSIKQWYIRNHGLDTYEVSTRNYEKGLFPRRGYSSEGEPSLDLNILPVWKKGITGRGTEVVVFDTGVDPNNPDLVNKIIKGKARDLSGYLYPIDFTSGNSHGTRVAGIIGAEARNFLGVRGIAYDAGLIPVIPNYRDIYALNYSFPYYMEPEKNQIFSSSIGAEPGSIDNFMDETDRDEKKYILKYLKKNAVINQSIGNYYSAWYREKEHESGKIRFYYTACRFYNVGCQYSQISSMGIFPVVNGIAACDSNGHHSYYSNASASNLVTAFGGTRNDTTDGLINYSRGIMTTDLTGLTNGTTGIYCSLLSKNSMLREFCDGSADENYNGDYTSEMNGTSAATPMVSAVAALIRQVNPKLTWADIRDILIKSSSHDNLASYMATSDKYNIWFEDGANLIIEDEAVTNGAGYRFSNLFGFGLIDAEKAVRIAAKYKAGNLKKINDIYMNPTVLKLDSLQFRPADNVADALTITTVNNGKKGKISQVALVISPEIFAELMDGNDGCDSVIAYYRKGSYYENNYLSESCRHSDLTFVQIEIISPAGTKSIVKSLGSIVTYVVEPSHPWELFSNAFYGENGNGNWQIRIITSRGERSTNLSSDEQEIVVSRNRSADREIAVTGKLKLFPLVSGEK